MLDEARAAGISIMGLHAGAIDGSSDEALAGTVGYIERVIDVAADLGVDLVVFTGMPTPADVPRHDFRQRIVRGLQLLLPRLARQEVRVGLENHYGCQIETVEDFTSIFSHLGNQVRVGAAVDTGHFTASGISPAWVVETLGAHVNHVHIKDHVGTQSVALGRGQTDLKAVIAALRPLNYDGWLTVELEVADRENAVRYVEESYAYMQNLLSQAQ
jgi:inosose dehydratase